MTATGQDISFIRRAYRPLLELGRGGMARVYLAESLASGIRKLVVLKLLNAELAADPEMRAAFRREAELSAQMNHPNVVQVFEVAEYSNIPVIAMEYLDGISLSQILSHVRQEMPLRLSLHILTQVLAGLHHFHELRDFDGAWLGAVHRDVSPQNVVVLHDGLVKVLDFGIAKVKASTDSATRSGLIKGKIHYMPPEQLLADPNLDRGADIFAVGAMLWEAVAQQRLWQGKTESDVIRGLATGELPRLQDVAPDVPEDLLHIVERALAINRSHRYATAHEMQVELEQLLFNHGEFVQPRELSDFMHKHFGPVREAQGLKVKNALRNPTNPEGMMDCITPARLILGEPIAESNSQVAQVSSLPGAGVISVQKSKRGWAVVLFAAVALAGAWFIQQRGQHPRVEQAVQPAVKTVQVEVDALPLGTEIFLDGLRVGQNHYRAAPAPSQRKALLEARAPGYVTERREITFQDDVSVNFVLQKVVEAAPAEASSVVPGAQSNQVQLPTASKARPRAVLRATNPRKTPLPSAAPSAPARNCSPAYTFSADGVKTYKPECF